MSLGPPCQGGGLVLGALGEQLCDVVSYFRRSVLGVVSRPLDHHGRNPTMVGQYGADPPIGGRQLGEEGDRLVTLKGAAPPTDPLHRRPRLDLDAKHDVREPEPSHVESVEEDEVPGIAQVVAELAAGDEPIAGEEVQHIGKPLVI